MHVDPGGGQARPRGDVAGRRRVEAALGEGVGRGEHDPHRGVRDVADRVCRPPSGARAARTAVSLSGVGLGTVDSMPHLGETKQALSQRVGAPSRALRRSSMPRNIYGPEHEDFRASVHEFVERTLKPRAEQMLEVKTIDRDIWKEAGSQGLFGLDIPEEFGGHGRRRLPLQRRRGRGASTASTPPSARASASTATSARPTSSTSAPRSRRSAGCPAMAAGEKICAIAMTEPGGGSDLAALKTTAVRDGDHWVLNGSKTFITNGYQADLVIVAARTDPSKGAKGITLFMVEDGMEGFTRGRKLDKVGQEESDTAELFFEDVRVPDANRIGEEGMGFVAMMQRLPQERVGAACANVAHAKQILLETIEYTKERKAFGQAIGSFQHNKFKIAELVTAIEVAEAYVDDCIEAHAEGRLTAGRRGEGQVVERPGAERRPRRVRPAARRLRLHERVPRGPRLARRPRHEDLGRLERDHEGAHRPRPRPLRPGATSTFGCRPLTGADGIRLRAVGVRAGPLEQDARDDEGLGGT